MTSYLQWIDARLEKRFTESMTATVEQVRSELGRILDLAEHGEEVMITRHGKVVAKLSGMPSEIAAPNRRAWLAKLGALRQQIGTGNSGLSVEQIIQEDRGE